MPEFLDLSGELRSLVYEYLFAGLKLTYVPPQVRQTRNPRKKSANREAPARDLAGLEILLVSKLCRQEACYILSKSQLVIFRVDPRAVGLSLRAGVRVNFSPMGCDIRELICDGFVYYLSNLIDIARSLTKLERLHFDVKDGGVRHFHGQPMDNQGHPRRDLEDAMILDILRFPMVECKDFKKFIKYWNEREQSFEFQLQASEQLWDGWLWLNHREWHFNRFLTIPAASPDQATRRAPRDIPVQIKLVSVHIDQALDPQDLVTHYTSTHQRTLEELLQSA